MTPEPVFCPYCNSHVPDPESVATGQRIPCPRCGVAFPYRSRAAADQQPSGQPGASQQSETTDLDSANRNSAVCPVPTAQSPALTPPAVRARSNRRVAAYFLAGMAVVALAVLIYALLTQGIRRDNDEDLPQPQAVVVPFVVRFGLGVYVIAIVYLVVGNLSRRGEISQPEPQTLAGGFSVPAIAFIGLVLVVLVIRTTPEIPLPPDRPPPAV